VLECANHDGAATGGEWETREFLNAKSTEVGLGQTNARCPWERADAFKSSLLRFKLPRL
jgi:hypothetical protein